MENFKSEKEETMDNDDILDQYQFVSSFSLIIVNIRLTNYAFFSSFPWHPDIQMQMLIVQGKLPCTKEESTTLAAIQLRIYELNYIKTIEELKRAKKARRAAKKSARQTDDPDNHLASAISSLDERANNSQSTDNPMPPPGSNQPLNLIAEQSETASRVEAAEATGTG